MASRSIVVKRRCIRNGACTRKFETREDRQRVFVYFASALRSIMSDLRSSIFCIAVFVGYVLSKESVFWLSPSINRSLLVKFHNPWIWYLHLLGVWSVYWASFWILQRRTDPSGFYSFFRFFKERDNCISHHFGNCMFSESRIFLRSRDCAFVSFWYGVSSRTRSSTHVGIYFFTGFDPFVWFCVLIVTA